MLTQYTTYDDIRAAIGVAEEEIPDVVLALRNYEMVLQFELVDLLPKAVPTLDAYFLTLVVSTHTATPDELRFIQMLQVFSAYVVARHLLLVLPMFAPVTVKDSKTELVRTTDPYSATKAGVASFYQLMRARVLAAYLVLFPSAVLDNPTVRHPLLAVGLGSDPVRGV